jgi:hypothetical protein
MTIHWRESVLAGMDDEERRVMTRPNPGRRGAAGNRRGYRPFLLLVLFFSI